MGWSHCFKLAGDKQHLLSKIKNPRLKCTIPNMNHKGVEFSVVQAANPFGWVWTVRLAGRERTGRSQTRLLAIARAQAVIDEAVAGTSATVAQVERRTP